MSTEENWIGKHMDWIAKVIRCHAAVHAICSEGDERPAIACPWCGAPTTGYFCNWTGNKHVWFRCEHCGEGFIK